MLRQSRRGVSLRGVSVGLLLVVLSGPWTNAVCAAEGDSPTARIPAQIEAGEFAPALVAARGVDDPVQRDSWLARIAAAQARVGARSASLRSAAEISDDRTLSQVLSSVGGEPLGGRGGGPQADFDELIELIQSTIAPDSWEEIGGPGSIAEFPGGVFVDARGVIRPLLREQANGHLAALHATSAATAGRDNVRQSSPLRKVSLPRLEKHLRLRLATGMPPTEAMQVLAGLQRVRYMFVYPDSGDLVLAGPAGNWTTDSEGRIVSTESGQPVVRLDDLVVVLRQILSGPDARFGCLIVPRKEALARVQTFLEVSNKQSIRPHQRRAWLEQLRGQLGTQDVEVYGIDPRTRAARVLVEADYRMKLVGMGLEEGVPGVTSYLDLVEVPRGEAPPPMGVLRWWFTLNYQAVLAAADHRAFELRGQGVQVLSENELLTAEGERVHTGKSEALTRQFARSFTEHFKALCVKYPIYAELRNICDLALAAALIREEDLVEKIGWHMTCLGNPQAYQVDLGEAPQHTETVVNHRVINRVHILAGVSGGVRVDPTRLAARDAVETDGYGALEKGKARAGPQQLPPDAWWWD
ncbi:MAG: DUF1598 domain-containing protein [Pirellulales bacterium]|nr:DUF1598 domain-containing protein [Pirellulales bacterium]